MPGRNVQNKGVTLNGYSRKGIDTFGQARNLPGSIALVNCSLAGGLVNGRNCRLEGDLCLFGGILFYGKPNGLDGTFKH